ncbi:MAG: hypothetical protein J5842_03750 [Lachnospiraceae bacterium]|nr:hypothetical protein [Lachnospiraceae bacterium]
MINTTGIYGGAPMKIEAVRGDEVEVSMEMFGLSVQIKMKAENVRVIDKAND